MGQIKQQRAAEQIRQVLSEIFLRELSDPQLMGCSITEVKIDRELRHANIYVTSLDPEVSSDDVMAGLARANGFLRRSLAQRVRYRQAPQLNFHWDVSAIQAEHMNDLLDSLEIPNEAPVDNAVAEADDEG